MAVGVMVPVGMEGKAVKESVDWEEAEGCEGLGVKLPTEVPVKGLEGEGVSVDSLGVKVEFMERVTGEVEVAEEDGLAPPAAAKEGVGRPAVGDTMGVAVPPAGRRVGVGNGLVGAVLCEPPPPPPAAPEPGPAEVGDRDREGRGEREALMVTRSEAEGEMEGVGGTVARELAVGARTVAVGVSVGRGGVGVPLPVKEVVGEEEGEKVTVRVGAGVSVTTGGVPEWVPESLGEAEEVPPPPPESGVVVGEGE